MGKEYGEEHATGGEHVWGGNKPYVGYEFEYEEHIIPLSIY